MQLQRCSLTVEDLELLRQHLVAAGMLEGADRWQEYSGRAMSVRV